HKVRLYSDLKIHFGLDIPFRRKDENVRTLVANEYQKLIENRTLKYLGYERTAHEYYHFYEYGSYLYLFGADGKLVSRWSPVTEERAYNNIMKKLCKESE
ncbi:MAG: hypothetical protein KDA99_25195, partial [Planctomycetales bacterium]|nr:hypothetical protein [Planctomycetales bacterium]